jgi:hypothetical protein
MGFQSLSRVLAVSLIACGGMSIACSDSTRPLTLTSPTPSPPPPPPAPVGFAVSSVAPSSGPTIGGDYIRISGRGFQSGVFVTIDGVIAPLTRVTDTVIDARTQAHSLGPVDVVVTNPDGQTVTLNAAYTYAVFSLTGGPSRAAPGAELTVSWVAPSGRGCRGGGDWIALYRVGDPDDTGASNGHSDLWFDHVCGVDSGTWKLKAPAQPAVYEFRFMVGDFSVARSDSIIVGE